MSGLSLLRYKSLVRNVYSATCSTRSALQRRSYCQNVDKLKEKVTAPSSSGQAQHLYRNERRPTNFDKKILLWSGRFKKEEDIPAFVSFEVIAASQNNVRIKICYGMIALTVVGCIVMVIAGKKASKEEYTMLKRNIDRKAKWRGEVEEQGTSPKGH
ncbi:protein FAM162A-like [Ascaphus truei]|uniref:protein FAM162A-like n=1 Tax=Ascaphus truei TaxID=8439 RepID=UPI003F5942CE